jgi:hypothetical protein
MTDSLTDSVSAQIASLELAVKIFRKVYTRFDLAILRVQR